MAGHHPFPHRSWQELGKSVVVYCTVHFWRGILEVLGRDCDQGQGSLASYMYSIRTASTPQRYRDMLQQIIVHGRDHGLSDKVRAWAVHKEFGYIAAGLAASCARMTDRDFWSVQANSNAVESSHFKDISAGRALTVVQAIE